MRRWLLIPLALAAAGAAVVLLVRVRERGPDGSGPPLDDIDDASRARLERVLEQADEPGPGAAGAAP